MALVDRDGNTHIHKGRQYVSGTYHSGWHPIRRKHATLTDEGHELHIRHMQEAKAESADAEKAIRAQFASTCSKCGDHINIAEHVWWHPKTRKVRHRGGDCDTGPDVPATEPVVVKPETPSKPASKKDLAAFEEAIRAIKQQSDAEVAALTIRVETAEQKATIARKASEESQRATQRAVAKIDTARRVEVVRTTPDGKKKVKKLKAQHVNFEKLLKLAAARINVALVGDAGSGKTYAGSALAKALGLDFYHIPLGPQTSKSDLLGYMNGAGNYVYSLLCRVYERGGVGLLDEMDAANPATLTIVNGMLEAIEAGFADKMRKRHPDCVFVAAMNTFGRGADMMFVGRSQLDAATLNRWYYLEWNTDWDLAHKLVENDSGWVDYVQSLYESASRQKVRATIGMRTAIMGRKAMDSGDTREEAEHGVIWAPMKPDDKQKILAGVKKEDTLDDHYTEGSS